MPTTRAAAREKGPEMLPRVIVAAVASLLLSAAPAAGAVITPPRYEISFSSVDTTYDHVTREVKFEQADTVMVIEGPEQQQKAFDDVDFLLTATLTDSSTAGGRATGTFALTTLSIVEDADPDIQRLTAGDGEIYAEQSTDPMWPTIAFTGTFCVVTDWGFDWDKPGGGEVFALAWKLEGAFGDFAEDDIEAESSVTLVAEPATVALLLAGMGVVVVHRRRRLHS